VFLIFSFYFPIDIHLPFGESVNSYPIAKMVRGTHPTSPIT